MKKYNYGYKITNTENGKFYYGIHSTDNPDDGYFGSGTAIKKAITKYGKDSFQKEVVRMFKTLIFSKDYKAIYEKDGR